MLMLLSVHVTSVLFLVLAGNFTLIWASIGVTHSYSSQPVLSAIGKVMIPKAHPTSWPEAVRQLTMCARDPPLPELGYHSVAKSPPLNSYKVSLNSLDTPPSFTQGGSVSPPSFAN